jgi:hypothetical protein
MNGEITYVVPSSVDQILKFPPIDTGRPAIRGQEPVVCTERTGTIQGLKGFPAWLPKNIIAPYTKAVFIDEQ